MVYNAVEIFYLYRVYVHNIIKNAPSGRVMFRNTPACFGVSVAAFVDEYYISRPDISGLGVGLGR